MGLVGAAVAWCQIPSPAGKTTGPGVQAPRDSREPEALKTCKAPPPPPQAFPRPATPPPPGPREYTAREIPAVVAAGQQWKEVWQVDDNSDVIKLDKDSKTSVSFMGTNTGGSVAMNSKGALFIANRGLRASIDELSPRRKTLANQFNGNSLDCIGCVLNDLTADSKGGAYFTMGGVFYADPQGKVTRYGKNLFTNGIVLSADEKHLYVTNRLTLAAFDVQKDGLICSPSRTVMILADARSCTPGSNVRS